MSIELLVDKNVLFLQNSSKLHIGLLFSVKTGTIYGAFNFLIPLIQGIKKHILKKTI